MTFEEWLIAHKERVEKDLNAEVPFLIGYINNSDIKAYEDVVLWYLTGIFDVAQNYTYEEKIRYLNSYIEMYKRDYDEYVEREKSYSNKNSSTISKIVCPHP